jgi:hypothetical protein
MTSKKEQRRDVKVWARSDPDCKTHNMRLTPCITPEHQGRPFAFVGEIQVGDLDVTTRILIASIDFGQQGRLHTTFATTE